MNLAVWVDHELEGGMPERRRYGWYVEVWGPAYSGIGVDVFHGWARNHARFFFSKRAYIPDHFLSYVITLIKHPASLLPQTGQDLSHIAHNSPTGFRANETPFSMLVCVKAPPPLHPCYKSLPPQ